MTTQMCTVCTDNPATVVVADMCEPCYANFTADVSRAHATDPDSRDRRYVTPDMIARDVRAAVESGAYLEDADVGRATRDGSGANFTITTSTGQTFRVIVTEIA